MLATELLSGDAIADRRADYAGMLAESGDPAGAAELMEQALERVPAWAAGWFRCGLYREKAGDSQAAVAALKRVMALDPQDLFGARLKLAVLGAALTPDHPSSRYIERFFDDYAERFDQSLVEKLGYGVPGALAGLLVGNAGLPKRFKLAVDLGCGTGLFGAEIRERVDRLEGFDLSRKMLAKAAAKRLYDHLAVADLSLPAADCGLFDEGRAAHRADLIVATDVMIYLGRLDGVFELAARIATSGAIFAFSVEDAGQGDGFLLSQSLRYAHSALYIEGLCSAYGFAIVAQKPTVIRMDAGKPVPGLLFIARNTL